MSSTYAIVFLKKNGFYYHFFFFLFNTILTGNVELNYVVPVFFFFFFCIDIKTIILIYIGTNNYVLIDCPDVQKFVSCSIQELNSGENKTESLPIFQFRNNTSMLLCGPFLPGDKPFYVQVLTLKNLYLY